jgi:NADP-dependent 3-hydroxy acid dehydrogenase YdfG
VYASMRGTQGKNREAAEAPRKFGIMTVELDVSDDASVEAGVKKVLVEAGKIDVLVNNAGIGSAGVTEAFTAEQAKVVFETNVIGLLRVTRAVLPSMRENRDGLIINIGSILGRVTFPFFGIYGASKFAVEALTDSLRYEVSQVGVEVVEVQPSAYPTNFPSSARWSFRSEYRIESISDPQGPVGRRRSYCPAQRRGTSRGQNSGVHRSPHDICR